MREYVTFSSKVFSKAPRPNIINRVGRCEDVADWLRAHLDEALPGGKLVSYQEDFGWVTEVQSPGRRRPVMMVAGNLDEGAQDTDEFGVYVDGDDQAPGATRSDVIAALDRALHDDPTIERIDWWDGGFMAGDPSPTP